MNRWAGVVVAASLVVVGPAVQAGDKDAPGAVRFEGYAEWREGAALIVDGQRVRLLPGARFDGKGEARDFGSIPLGYEVKVEGTRTPDGTVVARRVQAKPNGDALFEGDLRKAFDETEREFVRAGRVFEEDDDGRREDLGKLLKRGPRVERARRILDALVPPYADVDDYRLYVVDNKEWNAMAAPNGAIFVFTGLMDELDDDELAIVLGHELVHATHEHSRKGFKKQLPLLLGLLVVGGAAEGIDNGVARGAVQVGAYLTYAALSSGYGREHEDQADRAGMRYAYQAGYDVSKAPRLWQRFADKYGNGNKVVNFFFSDHSQARVRAAHLERELALNYTGAESEIRLAGRRERAQEQVARGKDDRDELRRRAEREPARSGGGAWRRPEEAEGRALMGFTVVEQDDEPVWTGWDEEDEPGDEDASDEEEWEPEDESDER